LGKNAQNGVCDAEAYTKKNHGRDGASGSETGEKKKKQEFGAQGKEKKKKQTPREKTSGRLLSKNRGGKKRVKLVPAHFVTAGGGKKRG